MHIQAFLPTHCISIFETQQDVSVVTENRREQTQISTYQRCDREILRSTLYTIRQKPWKSVVSNACLILYHVLMLVKYTFNVYFHAVTLYHTDCTFIWQMLHSQWATSSPQSGRQSCVWITLDQKLTCPLRDLLWDSSTHCNQCKNHCG